MLCLGNPSPLSPTAWLLGDFTGPPKNLENMDSRVLKIPMLVLLMSGGKWKLSDFNNSCSIMDLIINHTQEEMHASLKLSLYLVKLNLHILNCL